MEKYCRTGQATDDNIIRIIRFGCFVTKATDARSEYVILIAFSGAWVSVVVKALRY